MIHSKIRMKDVIENLATPGLSITYNRLTNLQEQVIKQEIKGVDQMGLAFQGKLKPNIFTTTE